MSLINSHLLPPPNLKQFRQEKSTKINLFGPETAWWGGCLPREGGGGRNVSWMFHEFCWDVPDHGGCSESLCKKVSAHVSAPTYSSPIR